MKIAVLMGIMLELLTNEKTTAKSLSEKFEVSQRTIYRYLDTLCQSGVPIISFLGKKGGFLISKNLRLNNLFLTKEEIDELLILCKNNKTLKKKFEYLKWIIIQIVE